MNRYVPIVAIVIIVAFIVGWVNMKEKGDIPDSVRTVHNATTTLATVTRATILSSSTPVRNTPDTICVGEYCDGSMSGEDTVTVVRVPLISQGGTLGCGVRVILAPHTVPKTTAVMDETYKKLFSLRYMPEIESDNVRNTIAHYEHLFYDHVTLQNGIAKVYLTGNMMGPGHCAEPEIKAQIEQSALQFDSVHRLEVYLNNVAFDWCTLDDSGGASECAVGAKLWVVNK